MKLILLLFVINAYSQVDTQLSIQYKTISHYDLNALDEEIKSNPMKMRYVTQMKSNMESIEYILKINKEKSKFETIFKMDVSKIRVNPIQMIQNKQIFYTDSKHNIEQVESLGQKFLITDSLNNIKWKLSSETKKVLGYICYKGNFYKKGIENIEIEAWYAPELPFSFGPKGYHGLPGLILEIKKNNIVTYTASKINWDEDVYISKPSKGRKITRLEFDSIMEKTVKNIKTGN